MSVQNLRNKYHDHPVFIPLIEYCDKNNIGFEIMKETTISSNYRMEKVYYMKIDDVFITKYLNGNAWNSLASMLAKAYTYVGLEIPESLKTLIEFFRKQKNV